MKVVFQNTSLVFSSEKIATPIAVFEGIQKLIKGENPYTGHRNIITADPTTKGIETLNGIYLVLTATLRDAIPDNVSLTPSADIDTGAKEAIRINSIGKDGNTTIIKKFQYPSEPDDKRIEQAYNNVWNYDNNEITVVVEYYNEKPKNWDLP